MRYVSTRGDKRRVNLSTAIEAGIAPDGGLFVPATLPSLDPKLFSAPYRLPETACTLLAPFFEGDPLERELSAIASEAFNFPAPLRDFSPGVCVLELFHGPTAAFKDFGARFLAAALSRIPSESPRTVLVATSGDTGGAVAAAFYQRSGFNVVILYPEGKVSPLQELQLTCWGENVRSFKVSGTFDDCQRLAKEAFADPSLQKRHNLTSANSINIGRLLPQMVYYATASLEFRHARSIPPGFIVPSGNLGNALAALLAMRMGLPIRKVVLAANANRPVPDYFASGRWKPLPTVATLANAMDVGNPSNIERLLYFFPTLDSLKSVSDACSASDAEIETAIRSAFQDNGYVIDPHTATAVHALRQVGSTNWILAATAHPAKFRETVDRVLGAKQPEASQLTWMRGRAMQSSKITPDLDSLRSALG